MSRNARTGLQLAVLIICLLLLGPRAAQAAPRAVAPPLPPVGDTSGHILLSDDAALPVGALTARAQATEATGDYRIDALLSGYRWPASWTTLTYSFYDDQVFAGGYYGIATGVHEVSEPVKANVRRILAWYATLINVDFVEVTETPAQIGYLRFLQAESTDDRPVDYARASYPTSAALFHVAGDVYLDPSFDNTSPPDGFGQQPGTHGYLVLIHEIGHALGLKHPFDDQAFVPSPPPYLPVLEDNDSNTLMTYNFRGHWPATPMPYDLLALQYLYGARAHRGGDDIYVFTDRGADQYTLNSAFYQDTPWRIKQTLWDSGGFNTLDMSALPYSPAGYRLDLSGMGWLSASADVGSTGNFLNTGTELGNGVVISALMNSSSADAILASGAANTFAGYGRGRTTGADVIYGADSADTLDLRGYLASEVVQLHDGNDLLLELGPDSSITLKDYYAGYAPQILFGLGRIYVPQIAR